MDFFEGDICDEFGPHVYDNHVNYGSANGQAYGTLEGRIFLWPQRDRWNRKKHKRSPGLEVGEEVLAVEDIRVLGSAVNNAAWKQQQQQK